VAAADRRRITVRRGNDRGAQQLRGLGPALRRGDRRRNARVPRDADGQRPAYFAVAVILSLIYSPLTMMRAGAHNGQTFGKQLMRIRVARLDGRPVTAGTAILRDVVVKNFLIWGLGSLLFYIPGILSSLWPLWDGQRQAWHDKAVSTIVVDA
jgi:uncharacterized RDD family membrane protein YckC